MSEKLRENTESIKLESKNAKSDNTQSGKTESKRSSKNNDEVRLDSNGDEIIYEVKHKLSLWDYFLFIMMLFLGIAMVYGGIKEFLSRDLEKQVGGVMMLIFGISCILASCHRLFYARKNRFYITTQGIGFERRHWFRMQKIFFKFGEVGVIIYSLPALGSSDTGTNIFIFCPINLTIKSLFLARFRDKNYKHYIFRKVIATIFLDERIAILTFMRQKTKEALESKGIAISDSELKDKFKSLTNKDI